MKKYMIERQLPGAGNLTPQELKAMAQASLEAISQLGKPYQWQHSYITQDKIYCIHLAENEEVLRQHARLGGFPIHTICEIKAILDPSNGTFRVQPILL